MSAMSLYSIPKRCLKLINVPWQSRAGLPSTVIGEELHRG